MWMPAAPSMVALLGWGHWVVVFVVAISRDMVFESLDGPVAPAVMYAGV